MHFVMTEFFIKCTETFIVSLLLEIRDSSPFQNNLSNFLSSRQPSISVDFKEVIWLSP